MDADRFLKFKGLRDKYSDQIENREVGSVQVEKNDFLDLLQATLERGHVEVQFNGKFTKLTPKEKYDGNLIDVTFTTLFGAAFLGKIGTLFGMGCQVYVEPVSRAEGGAAPALSDEEEKARIAKSQLGLPFDGPTAEPAPEEPHQAGVDRIASTCPACGGTSYVGEGSEEACDTCGGTGVVYTTPGVSLVMVPCGACDGVGNKPDSEGVVGACLVCHGTGKVEAEVTEEEAEEDDDLANDVRVTLSIEEVDPDTGVHDEPAEESA